MSDNRNQGIQRLVPPGRPAGAIMTPQGPAVIQVIDIPTGGGGLGAPGLGYGGPTPRKVGGINILGAILKRWWLVLIVTVLLGGAGVYAGNNFVKPVYMAHAKVTWIDRVSADGKGAERLIAQATDVLTSREIPILVAKDEAYRKNYPSLAGGRDLDDPAVQADIIAKLKDVATAELSKGFQTVDLQITRGDPVEAAQLANAFARAFVSWCQNRMRGDITGQIKMYEEAVNNATVLKSALTQERTKLAVDNRIDFDAMKQNNTIAMATKLMDDQFAARVALAAAQAKYRAVQGTGEQRPDLKLESLKLVEEEKAKDNILQTYNQQLVAAVGALQAEMVDKKEDHPLVGRLQVQVGRMKALVLQREAEIASIIRERIENRFKLLDLKNIAEAQEAVDKAQALVSIYAKQMDELDKRTKELVYIKGQITALDERIALVGREFDVNWTNLQAAKQTEATVKFSSGIEIAEYATTPPEPIADKRVKVQAAGMVGGLFLGMLLALLVDKFDKRLRDPRDVEPLLGAPLLGTIPRIGELKRIKGEHARNLIAEEFRIIRTQLLFGNPELQYKVIAITSPQPGDGKTSLAVNLAISIAKAGRRVLLIDGDLRKPDIHRIFNVSDSPGFAEVIAGSHEPGAVIRKSDIDGLEVLPAGTPMTRPSELLSRPEVARVFAALGEVYDHIILDTAPLLPVSDTHVLVGLVDAVITSFNADTDRNTVVVVQDILRRSRANVIGTVMNQVKYKQSGAYHRGKNAYSSYYSSTRVPPAGAPGKVDPNVATLTKL